MGTQIEIFFAIMHNLDLFLFPIYMPHKIHIINLSKKIFLNPKYFKINQKNLFKLQNFKTRTE